MKGRNRLFGFLLLLSIVLQGCDSFLTVEIPDSLLKEDYWKSRDHAKAALSGVYKKLGENIPVFIKWGGLRADIYSASSGDMLKLLQQDIMVTNSIANWQSVYIGINWTNSLIRNVHLVEENDRSFTHEEMLDTRGQGYAIRALYYFYLVRAFQDVPYRGEPYESDTYSPYTAASSESAVLDSIEADLARALPCVSEGYEDDVKNYGYITKKAVRAIWADVKLWRKKYEECITLCEEVEAEYKGKMLNKDNWFSAFATGNSTESIFEYQYTDDGPASTTGSLFYDGGLSGNYEALLYNVKRMYPATGGKVTGDTVRFYKTMYGGKVFKYTGISVDNGTYVERDAASRNKVNFIFYRFREVLLMKAEACGALGRYEDALAAVNAIREATSLETLTEEEMGTGEQFFNNLICERVAELAFEGKEWYTLVRIARNTGFRNLLLDRVSEHSSTGVKAQILRARLEDEAGWFLPYLDSEVEKNRMLEQKKFYIGKK